MAGFLLFCLPFNFRDDKTIEVPSIKLFLKKINNKKNNVKQFSFAPVSFSLFKFSLSSLLTSVFDSSKTCTGKPEENCRSTNQQENKPRPFVNLKSCRGKINYSIVTVMEKN
uniref:Uncharacterized protein n=1 Tax=Cacopsylla melanoneura TaxID=428564 RepID=A0A8D9BT21_9HEMI